MGVLKNKFIVMNSSKPDKLKEPKISDDHKLILFDIKNLSLSRQIK